MPYTRREVVSSSLILAAAVAAPAFAKAESFDAIVVGAGLAGLQTALKLQAAGLKVLVIEALARSGGRLHTLEVDGQRFDTGGVEVGAGYQRLIALAEALAVTLEKPSGVPLPMGLGFGTANLKPEQWAKSELNALPEAERATPPPQLLMAAMAKPNPLKRAADWLNPEHAALDIPLWDHLAQAGASALALSYMDAAANFSSLRRVSALDCLRRDALRREGIQAVLRIKGGSQTLTDAMAAKLKLPIRLGAELTAVSTNRTGATLTLRDGRTLTARSVVLTLPTAPLAKITFDPPLPKPQAQAIRERLSTGVTQIHLQPLRPYFEQDGLPPNQWFASPIERLLSITDAQGKVIRQVLWINGDASRTLDGFDDKALADWALLELNRMRPATRGAVRVLAVNSWSRSPFSGGAYAEIAAGRCASTAAWTAKPHSRVYFAGEHTEFSEPGLESALKSADRVVREIAQKAVRG